ncbi:MAG: M15 family metallopeptidase [Coriobacteriales bacterium]|nr:M15 family metallopeptidase [Coriobacteriales bacterium]
MRRIYALLLAALLTMGLSACKSTSADDARDTDEQDVYLTLVNPTHKLPDNWLDLIELVCAKNSLGEEYLVEKETLAHFEDLRAEVLKEEGIDIELDSAYRSVEEQQEIWDEFSKRYGDDVGKIVSEPGYSEHHTGLAVDVFIIDGDTVIRDNDDLFAAEELFAKVHKHLSDYGFILSVLPGKEEVCGGLAYEPWHFRYVGVGPAREMAERGIVLEEYLGVVEE